MKVYTTDTPIGEISSFENDSFAKQVMQLGYYAEQVILDNELKPYIEKSNTILDIGGHVGYHSIGYNRINPNTQIHTFEAQANMFSLLERNIKANNLEDKITIYNKAMGHKLGTMNMATSITDGPNANTNIEYGTDRELNLGGVSIGIGGEEVEMVTIDSLNLDGLDYIKIDVEGAESLVFIGGEQTIKKYHPVICFEHNHKSLPTDFVKSLGFDSLPTPFEILRSWGYTKFTNIPYENVIAE